MAKSISTKERIGRYTHIVETKNGKETHYLKDNLKKGKQILGNGIDGSTWNRNLNPFAQLIFMDAANMSNRGRRALNDLEPELFTRDVINAIALLVTEQDPEGKSKEAGSYLEAVMKKNPETAKLVPPPRKEQKDEEETDVEEEVESDEEIADLNGMTLDTRADYSLRVEEDEKTHETKYMLYDDKTNTTIGNGIVDNGIMTVNIADAIFVATRPGAEKFVENMYSLRPELFDEEVMGDLLRIVHDNMNPTDENTIAYINAIKSKNPDIMQVLDETEQPTPPKEFNLQTITDNEEIAGYVHRIVEKDGHKTHYLYDKENGKTLGEGIGDSSFPTDVHPIAALLSHDVATMDDRGKRTITNLRPELFNEEISKHLVLNAMRLYSTVNPTVENTKSYDDYLGLIADRHDLYLQSTKQQEQDDTSEDDHVDEDEHIDEDNHSNEGDNADEQENDVSPIVDSGDEEQVEEVEPGVIDVEKLAGYTHRVVEKDGHKTHYLYDTKNKTIIGNGIDDASFDHDANAFGELIFSGLGGASNSAIRKIESLRDELFTDVVTRTLISKQLVVTLKTEPTKESVERLSVYNKTVTDKFNNNPDKQIFKGPLKEKTPSNTDAVEKDSTVENKETVGRYTHKIVIDKDGNVKHYLYDNKTKNYLGNGVDADKFNEKANPFAELLFKDVARMSKNGRYNAEVLGKELFTAEVVEEMIKNAEASGKDPLEIDYYKKLLTDRRDGVERAPVTPPEQPKKKTERNIPKENGTYTLDTVGSYSHVLVVKDGVAIHYLHDDKEDKILGDGIDDSSFNHDENPFAVLLTSDVAVLSPKGINVMSTLRNDLFEKDVTHGLIKISTESLLIDKAPIKRHADIASAYHIVAAEKYDELVKEQTTANADEDENAAE